jgi:hypothetical protein
MKFALAQANNPHCTVLLAEEDRYLLTQLESWHAKDKGSKVTREAARLEQFDRLIMLTFPGLNHVKLDSRPRNTILPTLHPRDTRMHNGVREVSQIFNAKLEGSAGIYRGSKQQQGKSREAGTRCKVPTPPQADQHAE